MTYYRKQRMDSFKKAMFASRFNDKDLKSSLPRQPRAASPAQARRELAS